jgi:hypothetical protein
LRDQLLGELGNLASQVEATAWAQRALGDKNTLTTADAALVEVAFASRLTGFADGGFNEERLPSHPGLSNDDAAIAGGAEAPAAATRAQLSDNESSSLGKNTRKTRRRRHPPSVAPAPPENGVRSPAVSSGPEERVNDAVAWHIDKSALTLGEPRRYRDRVHLEFVSSQPCLLCGRRPSDAHHLRFAQPPAMGRRVSDEFAVVPLCRTHHRVLHSWGDEAAWWASVKIEPVIVAQKLWEQTRTNGVPVHRNIDTSPSAPLLRDPEDGKGESPPGPLDR